VFGQQAGGWMRSAYLKTSNADEEDYLTERVAVWGERIAVGATCEDGNGSGANPAGNNDGTKPGAVYIRRVTHRSSVTMRDRRTGTRSRLLSCQSQEVRVSPEGQIRIEDFRPEWREAFERLNVAWLEAHFSVEPIDQRILRNPELELLAHGGRVWFALIERTLTGTCALKHHGQGVYELTKMTVDERFRGRGIGRALVEHAIAQFRGMQGRELFLESHHSLAPALQLYESAGFVRQPAPRAGSPYARSDVYMVFEPHKHSSH
jgi:ribosomal protein S18 acetylase RimI-like enzyme